MDEPISIDEILDEVNRLDIEATSKPWRLPYGAVHPMDRQPDVACSEVDRALIAAYRSYAPALREEVLRLRSVLADVLDVLKEQQADDSTEYVDWAIKRISGDDQC